MCCEKKLRQDCANVKTCRSHRCLQKCSKIPFEPEHETWYMCCDENSGETVQMGRLVRAIAAYRNVPRPPLSQNMSLGSCAETKAQARLCKCEDLSEPSLLTEMCQDPIWARTWVLVHVLRLRLRRDCANVKTCQNHRCLQKCFKTPFEPEH